MVRCFFLESRGIGSKQQHPRRNYCTSKKGPLVPLVPFTRLLTTTTCFYDKFKLSKPIVWKRWHQQPLATRLLFVVENRNQQTVQLELPVPVSLLRVWRESQREHNWRNRTWSLGKQGWCTVHISNTITCFTDLVAYISKKVKFVLSIFSQPYSRTTRKHRWPHSGSSDFRNLSRGRWVPSTSVAHTSLAQACEHRLGPSHSLSLQKLESCNGPGLFRLKKKHVQVGGWTNQTIWKKHYH